MGLLAHFAVYPLTSYLNGDYSVYIQMYNVKEFVVPEGTEEIKYRAFYGCDSLEKLNDAVVSLYMDEVLPCVREGLCAAVYTQVSDVEDEINGLLTYDRKVEKLKPETMLPVAEALQKALL